MRYSRIPVFLLALFLAYETASAQTDYSLRMRSLSTHLSGIIDDSFTDVYLNPGRLGRLDRMHIYGARLPYRSVQNPFPISTTKDLRFGPSEDYEAGYSYEPLVFSLIQSIGDGMMISAGLQAFISGEDIATASPSYDLDEWGNLLTLDQRVGGSDQGADQMHLLLDLVAAGRGTGALGLRLRASHNRFRHNLFSSNSVTTIDLGNLSDTSIYEAISYTMRDFEQTDIAVTVGKCRAGGRLTDLSVSGAIRRQQYSAGVLRRTIDDTDADRNGERIGGGSPYLSINQDRYDSTRDYLGFRLSARAHWEGWKQLRFVHAISWNRSWGDGHAEFVSDDLYYGTARDIDNREGRFGYDGVFSSLAVSTATGYSKEVYDGILAMIGVKCTYAQTWFDEDGDGTAWVFLDQSNGSYDSLYYSSPYAQKHDNDERVYQFVIPLGCEWQAHDFINLRIGIEVTAYHSNSNRKFAKSVSAIDLPPNFDKRGSDLSDMVGYDTEMRFNSGIEMNIRNKLVLELLAYSSHSRVVNLAEYAFVSARYLF